MKVHVILRRFAAGVALAPACLLAQRTLDASSVALYARVVAAADARRVDTALFEAALRARAPSVRAVAALSLANLAVVRRADAVPQLRRAIGASDPIVVRHAAFGLGLAKDTASIAALARVARRADVAGSTAAWALGEIGVPARDTVAALLHTSASPTRTRDLLLAATKIRPVDTALVAPLLTSRAPEVRWAAVYALARGNATGAVPVVIGLKGDPAFRAEVARILTQRRAGDTFRVRALARLDTLARDADEAVRVAAARSLGTYGHDARAPMLRLLRDTDANVRVATAAALGTVLTPDDTAWAALWRADTGYRVRRSLLESAAGGRALASADSLWRTSTDWRLRAAAIGARRGASDTAAAVRLAIRSLDDADGRVRAAAYGVLAEADTAGRDSVIRAALARAATDPDTLVREELPRRLRGLPRDTARRVHLRDSTAYAAIVRALVAPALAGKVPRYRIATERGAVVIEAAPLDAPLTTFNFDSLVSRRFYDGARFHRVVPAFVAQDGDPRGDGNGGPPYTIRDELSEQPYSRGAVGMALSGPDTGGSQYFLTLRPQPHLDGHYPVFARVVSGFPAMDALVEGDRIMSIRRIR